MMKEQTPFHSSIKDVRAMLVAPAVLGLLLLDTRLILPEKKELLLLQTLAEGSRFNAKYDEDNRHVLIPGGATVVTTVKELISHGLDELIVFVRDLKSGKQGRRHSMSIIDFGGELVEIPRKGYVEYAMRNGQRVVIDRFAPPKPLGDTGITAINETHRPERFV